MFVGEKLVHIRNHEYRISVKNAREQNEYLDCIIKNRMQELHIASTEELIMLHKRLASIKPGFTQYFIISVTSYFKRLHENNKTFGVYKCRIFDKRMRKYLYRYLSSNELNLYSNIKTLKTLVNI
jgi:hypothetical protein